MNVIIAAIIGGLVLLWGGILGLLKLVDLFERKHMLFLGAYTTLVAGCVMGLVLFTNYQRQKESRRELQTQMKEFSGRLNGLSDKLVSQLDEKAQLTASEFEIRVKLQNEIKNHQHTQQELEAQIQQYRALKQTLDTELKSQREYRMQAEQQRQERHAQEEARYAGLRASLEVYRRSLQTAQKQLSTLQEAISQLETQTAGMQKTQTALLAKVNSNHVVLANKVQAIEKKLTNLTADQSASHKELDLIRVQIDSLYNWKRK